MPPPRLSPLRLATLMWVDESPNPRPSLHVSVLYSWSDLKWRVSMDVHRVGVLHGGRTRGLAHLLADSLRRSVRR